MGAGMSVLILHAHIIYLQEICLGEVDSISKMGWEVSFLLFQQI